jgi:prepilin-type N-terminal cleavage/methylation domain-containing protein/prepilin-type processing-associated H-X9-DG protein
MHPRRCPNRGGFSLIELLIVIAIIIVLMSIFLPAIMRAWETYNSMRCQSNLNNIAKAITAFSEDHGVYPTGGGDYANPRTMLTGTTGATNEPGTKLKQDWGWAYQILKPMGEDKVWIGQNDAQVRAFLSREYFCPSRRSPAIKNNLAMIDYAGNAGPWSFTDPATGNPYAADMMIPDSFTVPALGQINVNVNLPSPPEPFFPVKSGIFIKGRAGTQPIDTLVEKRHVYDGHSYTILVSEKRMNSHMYLMPSFGDRHGYCSGYSNDTLRTGDQRYFPARDERDDPNLQIPDGFGSAHPTAFNALFCDGHVKKIRYNMSLDMRTVNVRPPTNPINGIGPWAAGAGPVSPTVFGGPVNLTLFQRLCHRSDAQEVPHANFGD